MQEDTPHVHLCRGCRFIIVCASDSFFDSGRNFSRFRRWSRGWCLDWAVVSRWQVVMVISTMTCVRMTRSSTGMWMTMSAMGVTPSSSTTAMTMTVTTGIWREMITRESISDVLIKLRSSRLFMINHLQVASSASRSPPSSSAGCSGWN